MINIIFFLILLFIGYIIYSYQDNKKNPILKNKIHKSHIYTNSQIQPLLKKLRIFKQFNKKSYKQAKQSYQLFYKYLKLLYKEDINNYRHNYENAELYLQKSLKEFHSIGISIPTENIDKIYYDKNIYLIYIQKLGDLCKQLQIESHSLLLQIANILNDKYKDKLDIYKTILITDPDPIRESNYYNQSHIY